MLIFKIYFNFNIKLQLSYCYTCLKLKLNFKQIFVWNKKSIPMIKLRSLHSEIIKRIQLLPLPTTREPGSVDFGIWIFVSVTVCKGLGVFFYNFLYI